MVLKDNDENQQNLKKPSTFSSPSKAVPSGGSGTEGGAAIKSAASSLPAISLPKGGGAIKGIDEKFSVNPATGTGSLSIPIFTSPGRSDFSPKLSLNYDSGAGNGPFGLGWHLSIPAITRKTDKGIPCYRDAEESDVFILSGAEDLVSVFKKDNTDEWIIKDGKHDIDETRRTVNGVTYNVRRYRPRIEGLFARVEKWTNINDSEDTFWRSISRENITTWYGKTDDSRIADPAEPGRIFSWLICESHDDKGNVIVYEYKKEDSSEVYRSQLNESKVHERNRSDRTRSANRYLKRIFYGNRIPYYPELLEDQPPAPLPAEWLFEVVFDYGEHDRDMPTPDTSETWPCRLDPFSSYRAGFEVRTYRLCQRVLMFHHIPDPDPDLEDGKKGYEGLVRSTDFEYEESPVVTYLVKATQTGYVWNDNQYRQKSLPPMEFTYSRATLHNDIQTVDAESLENLPIGLDGKQYQLVDLDGEGLSGILSEQGGGWFYKQNLGNITPAQYLQAFPPAPPLPAENGAVRFAPSRRVTAKPSTVGIASGQTQMMDLAGDGQLDLVSLAEPLQGFYERTVDGEWKTFVPFKSAPKINWGDPNLRFIDLNGDGHADILITENAVFTWYPSRAEDGFGEAEKVHRAVNEEQGPALVFADATQSVYLADFSGDGLNDIARIRNGEVCYWPNLGYGRFGAKVTMANAPHFDYPDQFNQGRIRLGDIDGSGTSDIIYLGREGVYIWYNQSGNGWSERHELNGFPPGDNFSTVMVTDLQGSGTAYLVWSSPLPGSNGHPLRYIDLMGGVKPHLMINVKNNLGAETSLYYAPSTQFYLADRAAGRPWITRLPFPVHVVERTEIREHITGSKFTSLYRYHHGFFDGEEREFRGFGMVEQWDSEIFTRSADDQEDSSRFQTNETEFQQPPVYTRSWFHTGAYHEGDNISRHYETEYYAGDPQAELLTDTILPPGLDSREAREACRALKGQILRQEVYAVDDSEESAHPYTVSETNYEIRLLQPQAENRHAVFFTHGRETLSYHYERHPFDPRIVHELTLEVDDFGNLKRSVSVGYPRRSSNYSEQKYPLIVYNKNEVINKAQDTDWYRIGLPVESKTYEITGLEVPNNAIFERDTIAVDIDGASEIEYEAVPDSTPQKRLIEHQFILYRRDDLSGALPPGEVQPLALPYETYLKAYTPGLLAEVFGGEAFGGRRSLGEIRGFLVGQKGGYCDVQGDGCLWIPSGQLFFSPDPETPDPAFARDHFYLPQGALDPFGNTSSLEYDDYNLLPVQSKDALNNTVHADIDYRLLQPKLVTDPNNNRSAAAFDELGMVTATALMGKDGKQEGDLLKDFDPYLSPADIDDYIDHPFEDPHQLLGKATTRMLYDLWRYQRDGQPAVVYTLARETHVADENGVPSKLQHSFGYSDGLGREIMSKIQAEPGPAPARDPETDELIIVNGELQWAHTDPRWVGSGRTIFNNKGNPVKQYEPFFSDRHTYEDESELVLWGVTPLLHYDPLSRLIRTDNPNGTFSKVDFDPWQQITWDENDTVLESAWYDQRINDPDVLPAERRAAELAAKHANTPAIVHLDVLGRTFLTIAQNTVLDDNRNVVGIVEYLTHVKLDIEGNPLMITDARGNTVMTYGVWSKDAHNHDILIPAYDIAGQLLYQNSMDAGERWMLNNVAGNPIKSWDSRHHEIGHTYDELQRPTGIHVLGGDGDNPLNHLVERMEYGDWKDMSEDDRKQNVSKNLIGQLVKQYDGAGVVSNEKFDFKGNLLCSSRQLAKQYEGTIDWPEDLQQHDLFEVETYTSKTVYDALNRPLTATSPDGSIYRPTFNEANLLDKVDVNLRGEKIAEDELVWTPFVTNINYNAKGQRELITYANGAQTEYEYDPDTFRLTNLKTTRASDGKKLQDFFYTYDPVGNITEICDDAQQTVYFNNTVVEPHARYEYDALYQLIEATGREHLGQVNGVPNPPRRIDHDDSFRRNLPHPGDGQAMGRYQQSYEYDPVGNIMLMRHRGTDPANPGWERWYQYAIDSNRLICTSGDGEEGSEEYYYGTPDHPAYSAIYPHDSHGNMIQMPHLPIMEWDFKDQLHSVQKQVVNGGGGESAYYIYDAGGQRIRKVIKGQNGSIKEERLYLGGFEIYRKRLGETVELERETLHIMDDQQRIALVETKTIDNQTQIPNPTSPLGESQIRNQFSNHLGSACLELDEEAAVISYEEYYPYGSSSYQAGRSVAEVSLKCYRYTGKERDEESGLYYYGARYYAAWLVRWCSCDSVITNNQFNLFSYVNNNPIILVDKLGQYPCSIFKIPIHEIVTRKALKGLVWVNKNRHEALNFRQGLIKGVQFPDIPEGEILFADRYISRIISRKFGFESIEESIKGTPFYRSHYGDLQYLHSMSPDNAISAKDVRDKIITTISSFYDLARGKMNEDPMEAGRSLGVILHIVQDSWAISHTERDENGNIKGFQDYLFQITEIHGDVEGDKGLLPPNDEKNWEFVKQVAGTEEALNISKKLIASFLNNN